jgi:AcrR family transcriptional regulator
VDVPLKGFRTSPRRSASRPGKRAESKARNRLLILDAARRVFTERGYGATTVRDVIRATPLAPGTFYNYFKSKEEVFKAIREATAQTMRPILREVRLAAETPEAFVAGTFRTFFAYVAEHREKFEAMKRSNALYLRTNAPEIEAGFADLREDIEGAIARGLLPAQDAEYLAAAMLGVAFELAEVMLKRESPGPEATARFATALFVCGAATAPKTG